MYELPPVLAGLLVDRQGGSLGLPVSGSHNLNDLGKTHVTGRPYIHAQTGALTCRQPRNIMKFLTEEITGRAPNLDATRPSWQVEGRPANQPTGAVTLPKVTLCQLYRQVMAHAGGWLAGSRTSMYPSAASLPENEW